MMMLKNLKMPSMTAFLFWMLACCMLQYAFESVCLMMICAQWWCFLRAFVALPCIALKCFFSLPLVGLLYASVCFSVMLHTCMITQWWGNSEGLCCLSMPDLVACWLTLWWTPWVLRVWWLDRWRFWFAGFAGLQGFDVCLWPWMVMA